MWHNNALVSFVCEYACTLQVLETGIKHLEKSALKIELLLCIFSDTGEIVIHERRNECEGVEMNESYADDVHGTAGLISLSRIP